MICAYAYAMYNTSMAFTKNKEEYVVAQHDWQRVWKKEDYEKNDTELREIHKQYQEAKVKCKEYDMFPEEYYQVMNGGMSKEGAIYHSDEIQNMAGFQKYEVNKFKLDKYFAWLEFSKTPQEHAESRKRTQEIMVEINNLLTNLKK